MMKKSVNSVVLGLAALGLLVADIAPQAPIGVNFVPQAAAVIGVPWSPLSVGGVARRTTRRAVVYSSSAASAASAQQQATVEQQAATAPQMTHRPVGAPAIGTVVGALPAGCATTNAVVIDGVQYVDCAGVYYRAAFQSNNLVYVVAQP